MGKRENGDRLLRIRDTPRNKLTPNGKLALILFEEHKRSGAPAAPHFYEKADGSGIIYFWAHHHNLPQGWYVNAPFAVDGRLLKSVAKGIGQGDTICRGAICGELSYGPKLIRQTHGLQL